MPFLRPVLCLPSLRRLERRSACYLRGSETSVSDHKFSCLGFWAGWAMGATRARLLGRAEGEGQVKMGCHFSYCVTPNSHRTVWSSPLGLTELGKSKKVEPEGRGQKNKGKKGLEARGGPLRWLPPGYKVKASSTDKLPSLSDSLGLSIRAAASQLAVSGRKSVSNFSRFQKREIRRWLTFPN